MARAQLLLAQMDQVYGRLRQRLEGLTDDEYLWEPTPGCWTVRRDPSGAWVTDYAEPDPDPAPFTTIGWRLVHLADCKVMYHEWAFGQRALTFPDLPAPATAAGAVARLEAGQRRLREEVAGLTTTGWTRSGRPTGASAGRLAGAVGGWSPRRHHGGEIGCLRDLYRATASTRGRP